ncbi:MAG TPA: glycosyltransferase family 87 protein, partial [Candidatus Nanopelagicales bacterium]|nr:glycosyltransferase family 87 protein [Candidatus Nanopelagicales bacterium]
MIASSPRPRSRRVLAASSVALLYAIVAASAWVTLAPSAWAVDARRNLAAADALVAGTFGSVEGYLYSPLAALVTVPFTWLPEGAAIGAWLLLKVAVMAGGTLVILRGRPHAERIAAVVVAIGFLPILYDLELGNVTVPLVAAIAVMAWCDDSYVAGVPLGIALATVPKPQLIPILVWMLLFRRRALVGALVTAAGATGCAILVLGLDPYRLWVEALRAPAYLQGSQAGNSSLWTLPQPAAAIAAIAAVGATLFALRRGQWPGLTAALCLGVLVAPYTFVYAAGVLLCVVPSVWLSSPRVLLGLAVSAPVGLVFAMPAWVAAVLAASVVLPAGSWRAPGSPDA